MWVKLGVSRPEQQRVRFSSLVRRTSAAEELMLLVMRIDPQQLRTLAPQLRDKDDLPPREALLAFFALLGDDELERVVTNQTKRGWQIVALASSGLVVVIVDWGSSRGASWSWRHDGRSEDATVTASLYRITSVERIEIVEAWASTGFLGDGMEVQGTVDFALHLQGLSQPLVLRDPEGREGEAQALITALRVRL